MHMLISLISQAEQNDKLALLLDFLLSQEERDQLEKRIRLAQKLLANEQSQRNIARELGVSMTTITRCSNLLKNTPPATCELFAKDQP